MARSEIGAWMPFEIDRFFGSPRVGKMSDFQKWWYVSLLLRAWQAEPPCHLPDDENELMILAGATNESSWKKHSALVLGAFRATGNGYRVNARQLEIYEEKMGIREVNRLNGKKGGRPRKTETKPNGNQTVSGSSNSSSGVGVDFVPVIKAKFTLDEFDPEAPFNALCDVYPKPNRSHLGMEAYWRAIEAHVSISRPDRNEIANAIEQAAAAYKQAKLGTAKKFIPEMIAWLDKGIWTQDPSCWSDSGESAESAKARLRAELEKK